MADRLMHALPALVLLLLGACGPAEPLRTTVGGASLVGADRLDGWGGLLLVQTSFENAGDAPVHLFTDLLQVVGEDGARGTVRDFRDSYRVRQALAANEDSRHRFKAMIEKACSNCSRVGELLGGQIEVLPGQKLQRTLPFLLRDGQGDLRYTLHVAYHDDGTDRITRLQLPVRVRRTE